MKKYVKCNKNDIANITRLVEDLHEWYMTSQFSLYEQYRGMDYVITLMNYIYSAYGSDDDIVSECESIYINANDLQDDISDFMNKSHLAFSVDEDDKEEEYEPQTRDLVDRTFEFLHNFGIIA